MGRFRLYRQLEHSDCGIACVRMLARYYGLKVSAKTLRGMCDMSRLGISVKDILDACRNLGMDGGAAKVSMDEIWEMPLPAIIFWDQKHFVVLYEIDRKNRRFKIADPASGKVTLTEDDFARHWKGKGEKGIAVMAAPTDDFNTESIKNEREGFPLGKMLRDAAVKYRKSFVAILMFTIISMAADLTLPFLFQRTVDEGISSKDIHLVWMLVISQLFVFLGNYVTNNAVDIMLTKLGLRMSIDMMNEYLRKLIKLPMSFFDRKVNSDLIQKVNDQERIKGFLLTTPTSLIITTLTLIIFPGLLVYFSYPIFIIFLILTLLSLGWSILFLRKRREIDYSYFTYASENRNALYELIYGMPEIKSNNAQEGRVEVWNDTQKKINRLSIRSAMLDLAINSGGTFFIRLRDIAITGICATLVIQDEMTIGVMMTVSYIVGRLSSPFSTIAGSINSIQDASMSYNRLSEILNQSEEERGKGVSQKEFLTTLPTAPSIRFEDVWFKYPGSSSPFVIKDVDVEIPAGKITALVGNSGSGKSTLIKLMLSFYAPTKGKMYGGSTDMADIHPDDWLKMCGAVMQTGYIFSDTVMRNIALSDPEPDEKRVREAAKLACIDSFIDTMPMGYHTFLGERGVELSGGQKQRLFIARAIYKNPQILFLDEATSSLDAENELHIVENLRDFRKGKTVVIAAHRLSTVKDADNILFIEDGRIAEQGTHNELIALKGKYYHLVKNQLSLGE